MTGDQDAAGTSPHPTGSPRGPVRIELMFADDASFYVDWEAKFERAEKPSRWPYGLEKLAWYADEVHLTYVPRARKWHRLARPVTDRLTALRIRRRPGRDIGITWDENIAIRMVTSHRKKEMYSGAIWLADRVHRGEKQFTGLFITALREMDGIWLNSRPHLEPMRRIVGPGPRLQFATFGVDETFFSAHPLPEQPTVVSIGTDRDRDWETLLAAYRIIRQQRPDVRLQLQAAAEMDLPDYVHALPFMNFDELREVYRQASVVAISVHPNLHVSGLTVSIEARASGRPVVASSTVGMADFMTDGLDVSLVPVHDPQALAAQILRLLDDREAAARMGRAGRAQVEDHLTATALVADLARLMQLQKRATPGKLISQHSRVRGR